MPNQHGAHTHTDTKPASEADRDTTRVFFIVDDSCSCCNTNVELILQTRCEVSKVQRTNETGKQNAKLSSKNENDSVILKM